MSYRDNRSNKKFYVFFSIIVLAQTIYYSQINLWAFYYTYLSKNPEIEILEIDINKYKTYSDILKINEFENKPSFIYFNTRYNYDRLEKNAPVLNEIYSRYGGDKLNLIFIANGLDNEPEERNKWIFKINKLELKGTHISLPADYHDFYTYFKEDSIGGSRRTFVPHYLLANKNGIITDTIFEGKIYFEKIQKILK